MYPVISLATYNQFINDILYGNYKDDPQFWKDTVIAYNDHNNVKLFNCLEYAITNNWYTNGNTSGSYIEEFILYGVFPKSLLDSYNRFLPLTIHETLVFFKEKPDIPKVGPFIHDLYPQTFDTEFVTIKINLKSHNPYKFKAGTTVNGYETVILSEMLHPRCYEQIDQVSPNNKSYQPLIKIVQEFPYFSYIEYQTKQVKAKAIPCMHPHPVFVNIPYNDVTFFGYRVNILLEFTGNELTGIGEFKNRTRKTPPKFYNIISRFVPRFKWTNTPESLRGIKKKRGAKYQHPYNPYW